jgi:hypothetical protein
MSSFNAKMTDWGNRGNKTVHAAAYADGALPFNISPVYRLDHTDGKFSMCVNVTMTDDPNEPVLRVILVTGPGRWEKWATIERIYRKICSSTRSKRELIGYRS